MLTARQKILLQAIINEFINSAQAVGSLNISEKYDLDVSPATIRNEMGRLTELGLLDKQHASAGRVPTSRAIKWFLSEVLDHYEELDAVIAAGVREELFQKRFNVDKLLTEAVGALSRLTLNTSVAVFGGRRYSAGLAQALNNVHYHDIGRYRRVIEVLEDYKRLAELFTRSSGSNVGDDISVLVGEETGIDEFSESAVVFAPIKLHGMETGFVSVVGPNRMNYAKVLPAMKYVVKNVQDVVAGW